jgi:hypothetical protein
MDTAIQAEAPVTTLAADQPLSDECAATSSASLSSTVAESSSTASSTPPTTNDDIEDEENDDPVTSLERDHPSFEKATISIIIQLLPDDAHPDGRLALVAVKSHNLAPLTRMHRLGTLGPFPDLLSQLMAEWQTKLPTALAERIQERAAAKEREKAKEVERKAKQATAKKPDRSKPTVKTTAAPSSPSNPIAAPTGPADAESQSQLF